MTFAYHITIHHVILTIPNMYYALIQGDYTNAHTENEAITTFLDDYKDAMENRKAGQRSFR